MMQCVADNEALSVQLDRPVWSALTTRQSGIALSLGAARRMQASFGPFAATRDDKPESLEALARLAQECGGQTLLLQALPVSLPSGMREVSCEPAVQMICDVAITRPRGFAAVRLNEADAPAMRALAGLADPGPFAARTHRLGTFWGVKQDGRLIAMAGERLRQPGLCEISAVSVDPGHRGKGLGSGLVRIVASRIQERGELPYLHALSTKQGAIRLYRRLGFRLRAEMVSFCFEAEPSLPVTTHDRCRLPS